MRVKWHVFTIIDFSLPAPRVTSQVHFPSCVSVNGVCLRLSVDLPVCGLEPATWNEAQVLWFKPHDTVRLTDNKKKKTAERVSDALSFMENVPICCCLLLYTSYIHRTRLRLKSEISRWIELLQCEAAFMFFMSI